MKTSIVLGVVFAAQAVYGGGVAFPKEVLSGVEVAIPTLAPLVPPPIQRNHPTKVKVYLEVKEVVKMLPSGVQYTFWTFGGEVPGKFIRLREGDEVEFHLSNHGSSKMSHYIDLHEVTSLSGRAVSHFTAPGHTSLFSFRAMNPGLFLYHGTATPEETQIANGLFGLILVEPREGMPKVDHESYVTQGYYGIQGGFYVQENYGEVDMQPFSNGSTGPFSLANDKALTVKAGETIRLFRVSTADNGALAASFHVIRATSDLSVRFQFLDVPSPNLPKSDLTKSNLPVMGFQNR